MYPEDGLLPLSALQHLLFCPRQCALIHVERQWEENRFTAEGRVAHEKVHEAGSETRGGRRIVSGLPLRSLRLGLSGQADVVEFEADGAPFPVEHKRGRAKEEDWDRVQLCAQALCLEEMTGRTVERGALFYGKTRRREGVVFDADLRRRTEETAARLHELVESGRTPSPEPSGRCRNCSLASVCLPGARRSVEPYLRKAFDE
ncbi:MAG: CRISPR-associated protein Cas4 [Desulfovibrio aminophilus]|uniref:CRISPR-associated protein Cas4 n=1 Tax=Desulfovibrio aminophilus TaxID=81425 RepID=UPI0039EB9481